MTKKAKEPKNISDTEEEYTDDEDYESEEENKVIETDDEDEDEDEELDEDDDDEELDGGDEDDDDDDIQSEIQDDEENRDDFEDEISDNIEEGDVEEENNEAEEDDAGEEEEGEVEVNIDGEGEDYVVESKVCYAKNLKKETIALDDEDSIYYANLQPTRIPDNERITGNTMTMYELVRILGTRTQMINLGAPSLINIKDDSLSPLQIAFIELKAKKNPLLISRPLANKKYEIWKVRELDIIHEITDEMIYTKGFNLEKLLKLVNKNKK